MMRITFLGAAGTVTGSKYLVETDSSKILIDCGLFQGKKDLRRRNWEPLEFDPSSLDAVVLTHAHIDHTGYLPLLVRRGFRGPAYCSAATKELLGLLLPDSASLQEEQAAYVNRHGATRHDPALPLYTSRDASDALALLQNLPRERSVALGADISVSTTCAGHILGSLSVNLDSGGRRVTFSGDIGRYSTPILPDPTPPQFGDLVVCEATYGNRDHEVDSHKEKLAAIVTSAVERGGPLIIPAFAVGRTQTLLYYLAELEREERIPIVPVFVDSPMAVNATSIYRRYHHDYDQEATALFEQGHKPIATRKLFLCRTVRESKALNELRIPRIIVSASGMVTGGRILHHMRHWLGREETTVLFVGYQAVGTRGRDIQEGAPDVKIFGSHVAVRAARETISGLSAHADRYELLRWLQAGSAAPSMLKLVHAEPDAADSFRGLVREKFDWNVSVAKDSEVVEV